MIDFDTELVLALKTVLPTHYELVLKSGMKTPCISYQEISNFDDAIGDTLGYSRIAYRVKVWGNDLEVLKQKAREIDAVLKPLGFKRTSGGGELYDNNSTMIQKIMNYEALASENY
jgi:hypothetical protein